MDASWDGGVSCASVLLTYDLVSRIGIESGAYPIFFEIGIQNLACECILDGGVSHPIFVSL